MSKIEKKTDFIFYQISLIGLISIALIFYFSFLLYDKLSLVWASILGKLETICGCPNHFTFLNHPWLFTSIIIAGFGLITFLGFAVVKIFKLKKTTNKFVSQCLKNKKPDLSTKLKVVAKELNLENRIIEINDHKLLVFCFGNIKPKICISSAFIKKLNQTELKAVLLHEQNHLRIYDPARLFIINIITKVLFIIPGLKTLAKKYFVLSELNSDQWAIKNSRGKSPLAQAVYKILEWKEKVTMDDVLNVPSFNSVTEERVNKIVNDNYAIRVKVLSPKFIISLLFLSSFALSISLFIFTSNQAIATHEDGSCLLNFDENNECEMVGTSECRMNKNYLEPIEESICTLINHSKLDE